MDKDELQTILHILEPLLGLDYTEVAQAVSWMVLQILLDNRLHHIDNNIDK